MLITPTETGLNVLKVLYNWYFTSKKQLLSFRKSTYYNALCVESEKREAIICKSAVQSCSTHSKVAAHWLRRGGQREKTRQLKITSNDIIAGNGRILKVYMNIVCLYLSKKLYYFHELFFIFPSDAYSTTPAFQPLALGRGMAIRVGSAIRESSCSYNILLEIFKH